MKSHVLKAIPEVFSLRTNDYSRFVVKNGAVQMMDAAWTGVGARMNDAIGKVAVQVKKQNIGAKDHVQSKESCS